MIEVFGDIWDLAAANNVAAVVVTTNGFVKKNGKAVMGRGIAKEASKRYPGIDEDLGDLLYTAGNQLWFLATDPEYGYDILSFPVKDNWWEKAKISLIEASTRRLVDYVENTEDPTSGRSTILLPRPGCGNGGLKWEDVKPIIEPYLDDRFWVCHK